MLLLVAEASVDLRPGDVVFVERGGVLDAFGEINGERSKALTIR